MDWDEIFANGQVLSIGSPDEEGHNRLFSWKQRTDTGPSEVYSKLGDEVPKV